VQETAPEQLAVAAGVEGQGAVHELLHGVERGRLRGERGDLASAVDADLGTDVDEDEPGQPPAVPAGPGQRVDAAERHAHQHEPLEPEGLEESLEVADVALGRVVHLRRPLAVAVAALVEGQAVTLLPERRADEVPGVRVEAAAVQEHHGRQARRAPVEIVQAHAPAQQVMLARQHDLGQADPGGIRRQLQVRAELVGAEAHAASASARR
jgi:hypothetical protein